MKKTTLGLGAMALVLGVTVFSAGTALAYKGDPTVKGPNYSVERHTAMTKAFENKDYDAWKNLMQGKGRVTQVVNKDNFAKFAEAHQLALQGKTAEAQKIRQELGLGLHNGSGKISGGMGMHRGMNR
ncbi:MAG: hypothetical protein WC884_03420 [Candidatus Paceibacterota bacterium]